MLERVKFIQESKIDELLQLEHVNGMNEYYVKAPTGSGKTYMEGYLISQLIKKYPKCKVIYQSLSKGDLTYQNAKNIIKYNFANIKPYILSTETTNQEHISIPINYNLYFLPRDLNKSKGLLEIPIKNFLQYKTKNITKFLIIDECHEAHKNVDRYKNEFDKIYGFSATPTVYQTSDDSKYVELEDNFCVKEEIIKKKQFVHINEPIFPQIENTSEINDWITIKVKQSIEDFKMIKKNYEGSGVNPALIIQISNKFNGQKQKEIITTILNNEGILWYYRDANGFDSSDKIKELKELKKEKAWEYVKNDSSNIDVIIFKLTINTGIDIPRACYLLQIRKTRSETLDEQVIGRIRRNPLLKKWDQVDNKFKTNLLISYINGVEQQETRKIKYVKRVKNTFFKTTILKNKVPSIFKKYDENLINKWNGELKDIFKLKENWDCLDGRIKNEYKNITKDEWIKLCLNVNFLNRRSFKNDYRDNIQISNNAELQETTFYREDPQKTEIKQWNWKNDNYNDNIYSFESVAELQIAEELKNLNLTLWGKNWYSGSKINYEYFLRQKGNYLISKQYPDFFVIKNNRKYLIEVKNFSGNDQRKNINRQDYHDKVESIKKLYKEISQITDQIMVLIIKQDDNNWFSYVYEKDKDVAIYKNKEKFDFFK